MQTKKHNIIIAVMGLAIVILLIALFTNTSEAPSALPEEETTETSTTEPTVENQDLPVSSSGSWTPPTAPPPTTTSVPPSPSPSTNPGPASNVGTVPSQDNLAEAISVPQSVVVSYNGSRFWPEEAVVAEGGRVHFVNNSDTDMWIASDNHPRHDRYLLKDNANCGTSDFDQCAAIGPGESWTFVFNRPGTWGYHNHVDAKDTGTVVVVARNEL